MNAQELTVAFNALESRVNASNTDAVAQSAVVRDAEKLLHAHEKEIALLRQELDQLQKWQAEAKEQEKQRQTEAKEQEKQRQAEVKEQEKEWYRRFWAFGPSLLSALVSGVIAFLVAFFVRR